MKKSRPAGTRATARIPKVIAGMRQLYELMRGGLPGAGPAETKRQLYDRAADLWHVFTQALVVAQAERQTGDPRYTATLAEGFELAEAVAGQWARYPGLPDPPDGGAQLVSPGYAWRDLPKDNGAVMFRFGLAAVVGLLAGRRPRPALLAAVPDPAGWRRNARFTWTYLDAFLAHTLLDRKVPRPWKALAEHVTAEDGEPDDLRVRTFRNYFDLVWAHAAGDARRAAACRERAAALYAARNRSDVFPGWDGGVNDHGLGYDVRLEAIETHLGGKGLAGGRW